MEPPRLAVVASKRGFHRSPPRGHCAFCHFLLVRGWEGSWPQLWGHIMSRISTNRVRAIGISVAVLAALGGMALAAQDKYSVQVPDGLSFSDFRGYEGWQVVSVA